MLRMVVLGVSLLFHPSYGESGEQSILSTFFDTCAGDEWIYNENWLDNSVDICSWFGITCNSEEEVKMIRLRDNNIQCEIPVEIFYLPSLMVLDLSGNKGVSIDFERIDTKKAANLLELYLTDASVGSLKGINLAFGGLNALSAGGNSLTGEFPSSALNLIELTALDLSHNFLSGKIPETIGEDLSKLQSLLMSFNLLSSTIPSTIGNLKNLSRIMLQSNYLTGTLPKELNQLSLITQVCLNDQTLSSDNGLSGTLLDFASASYLLFVDVRNNIFTGTVPGSLLQSLQPKYSKMSYVDMSNNQLTGTVPAALSRFKSIRLHLFGNKIESIDIELCHANGWFFGEVGLFGCDAIMCPPGTSSIFGRQISAIFPCRTCELSRFYGTTNCEVSIRGASDNSKVVMLGNSISENEKAPAEVYILGPSRNSKVVVLGGSNNSIFGDGEAPTEEEKNSKVVVLGDSNISIFGNGEGPTDEESDSSIDWSFLSRVFEVLVAGEGEERDKSHGRAMLSTEEAISSGESPSVYHSVMMILSCIYLFL